MTTSKDRAILNSIINPLIPIGEFVTEGDHCSEDVPDSQETEAAKQFEKQGVQLAESGKLKESLEIFAKAINVAPKWSSSYNNRAQVYRLLNQNEEAMNDLNTAIDLSNGLGKAACQAFCQRAMLFHLAGDQEEERKNWEFAAKLGSAFAKSYLVQMNPYAALCNKMLHGVFSRLKETDGLNQ